MPIVGEAKFGRELGKINTCRKIKYIWAQCPICKEERWAQRSNLVRSPLGFCHKCNTKGERNGNWKGRSRTYQGYIYVTLLPNDFFFRMANKTNHRVLEQRLVMAKYLKRHLLPWEVVHHKNGIKADNRLENLELLPTNRQHLPTTKFQAELAKRDKRIADLEQRVTLLEAENTLLRQGTELLGEVEL